MNHRFVLALLVSVWAGLVAPSSARAHGLFGHVHVTGWAAENLPPGELRELFEDPEVFNALLMGATFPDTGYALGDDVTRAYGEHSHWEPFVEDFIQHLRTNYAPPYDTLEERKLVAFLMGCAAHGLQDELFDSTFLFELEQRDGGNQDASDPGTDAFLVVDEHARLYPVEWVPMDDLLPLYADLGQPITAEVIGLQVRRVLQIYVNDSFGKNVARGSASNYASMLPWSRDHYLDPSIPGSLRAEIAPTRAYLEAIWERLHGRFDEADLVIHSWPDAPRRLREAGHASVASWVTLVFGVGVHDGTAVGSIRHSSGTELPVSLADNRWAGGTGFSRLVRFRAEEDYAPGETYVATMAAGRPMIDGRTTSEHSLEFQVECADASDARCPPLPRIDDPVTEPRAPSSEGCAIDPGSTSSTGLLALVATALVVARRRRRLIG